ERTVVEARHRDGHRDQVQPREVAGENEPALRPDDYETRERGDRLRREEEDRRDELRKVIAEHLKAVERFRQVMEIPRERVGHGLRLVVVVQAREVAPAAITAHLDEPRAE